MTLKLSLPEELEQRPRRAAQRKGMPAETCAMQVLDKCLPTQDQRADAVALLQSWIDEADDSEQQETGREQASSDEDELTLKPPPVRLE